MVILSLQYTHDSSVSILEDGKLVFFMKEERLSRVKRDGIPFMALKEAFDFYKKPIDKVLIHKIFNDQVGLYGVYDDPFYHFIRKFFKTKNIERYSVLNHHLCHANLAFYNSGFDEALVFVADGGGSVFYIEDERALRETESLYYFNRNNQKKALQKNFRKVFFFHYDNKYDNSFIYECLKKQYGDDVILDISGVGVGFYYGTASGSFGEKNLEAGKAMGLSSYGVKNPKEFFKDTLPLLSMYNQDNFIPKEHEYDYPVNLECTKEITKQNYQLYANYCKLVQNTTEEKVLEIIKYHVVNTKINKVCLCGGYANNIVTNAYLKKHLPNVDFYFEPVSDDSGISIGASFDYFTNLNKNNKIDPIKNNFYISYKKEEINDLRAVSLNVDELLEFFLQQKTIAIFDGQPEAGQRALGHRSIIFDARNLNGKDIVNVVKKREWYRPFAGVIRKEDFKDYFFDIGIDESPSMMVNFDAKEHTVRNFPSIIHIDKTCRIQTVTEGFFYDFITLLKVKTGCPIILNTSFNLAGEPLVHSVEDAIRTFDNSNLDVLYFVEDKKALIK